MTQDTCFVCVLKMFPRPIGRMVIICYSLQSFKLLLGGHTIIKLLLIHDDV